MEQYHALLKDILANGEVKDDRTGVGTISVFARQLRFDLKKGFPAVTTKRLAWKAVVGELLWFLEGSSDERRLAEITHGTRDSSKNTIWTGNAQAPYWTPNAKYDGDLGRVYGVQWRDWNGGYDQLMSLVDGLKTDPTGRRHILTAWNVSELGQMALPPCHVMSQYYVSKSGKLSCHMYQRSVDVFLGLPFNIASYALLTHLLAHHCGLGVGELIISTGDTHIYKDHVEQVKEQLQREPFKLPTLVLNSLKTDIFEMTPQDIALRDYQSHDTIKARMAV